MEKPPNRVFLDSQTVQLSKVDPKIRGQVKELMMKDVKFAPSVSGRNQNTYIEPKRTESQMTKPLSGYRLRDLKTRALTSAVYNNPRPRPLRGVVATVFGATGFLGTQVAAQLSKYGAQVVCPVRPNVFGVDPYGRNEFRLLKLYGDQGQVFPVVYDSTNFEEVSTLVSRSQIVFNCIGSGYAGVNSHDPFGPEGVFCNLPRNIARACQLRGVQRFVHTSHVNADPNSSNPFFKFKAHGEEAVLEEFPNSVIVRPTAMFGNYDSFTVPMKKWLRTTNFPFSGTSLFLMEGSEYVETQPVWVVDVARAMVRAAMREHTFGETYQLAGPDKYKLVEIMRYVESISSLDPAHIRVYSPLEAKLRFDRPGKEKHQKTWIDMHMRQDVIAQPGAKGWEELEMDTKDLTKIESISGDWLTDSSYKGINHGMDLNWHVRYQPETYGAGNVPVKLPINILGVIGILAVLYTAKICFFV
uniref:NAD(P)-binding domain-containing protein n=1 Tax=Eutreptiella gymnastica TaxID=73025 RepID=A0A7S4CL27_9EUGL